MPRLELDNRLKDPDRAYRLLIDAHRGLSEGESAEFNTRLILILANHIGDEEVLAAALTFAKNTGRDAGAELESRESNES